MLPLFTLTLKSPLLACYLVSICFSVFFPCCESQTAPPNFLDCKLNASSPFSYVVKLLDKWKKEKGAAAKKTSHFNFGSLITYQAVLATAWNYRAVMRSDDWVRSGKFDRFTVTAQHIWDYSSREGRKHPCYQSRKVRDIQLHPKARGARLHYDFSVVVLNTFFNVTAPSLPSIFFPNDPLELLLQIRHVNIMGRRAKCAMPVPQNLHGDLWIFNDRIDVSSIPFHTRCVKKHLCEQHAQFSILNILRCHQKFEKTLNATMLCMVPFWNSILPKDDPPVPTTYAGVPLVCNGSTLGITSQVKAGFHPSSSQNDFFFVITLLRAYPWLIEKIKEFTVPYKPVHIDDEHLDFVDFPKPTREPTPDWGMYDFYRLPDVANPFAIERSEPKGRASNTLFPPCFWKMLLISIIVHVPSS